MNLIFIIMNMWRKSKINRFVVMNFEWGKCEIPVPDFIIIYEGPIRKGGRREHERGRATRDHGSLPASLRPDSLMGDT